MYIWVWDVINMDFWKSCLVFISPRASLRESLGENGCLWEEKELFQESLSPGRQNRTRPEVTAPFVSPAAPGAAPRGGESLEGASSGLCSGLSPQPGRSPSASRRSPQRRLPALPPGACAAAAAARWGCWSSARPPLAPPTCTGPWASAAGPRLRRSGGATTAPRCASTPTASRPRTRRRRRGASR